ncbi:lysozyme-like protein [Mycena belliarum]|uniref:Lysozyme-like protein n=1 Tax=Mycena belliarum TaxID=1033014 RepID=A0AAD6XLA9_9AGAR|nr:lysozyme-like protein [Mycena belliae]
MLLALPIVILSAILSVQADIAHGAHVARHHARISVPRAPLESPKLKKRKSCKARNKTKAKSTEAKKIQTSTKTTKKSTAAAKPTNNSNSNNNKSNNNKSNNKGDSGNTNNFVAPAAGPPVAGLIHINVDRCGGNGATKKITSTTGPNGSLDWLNCGINSGGWNPPYMGVNDIIAADLTQALTQPGTPFKACSDFVWMFEKYANQYGLKAIMLASFAMQESSCNPSTVGGAGEQGLMQLTKDKCGGAPGGNCRDPEFNIKTGAKYFAETLSNNNGNLLLSIGMYNGWYKGLTVAKATAAKDSACCYCQNNLDYLHQFMNGWVLNVNAYSSSLGKYHNLQVCPGKQS